MFESAAMISDYLAGVDTLRKAVAGMSANAFAVN